MFIFIRAPISITTRILGPSEQCKIVIPIGGTCAFNKCQPKTYLTLAIDILIGVDYYWDLIAGSPTAIHTIGWVGSCLVQWQLGTQPHILQTWLWPMSSGAQADLLKGNLRAFWELESLGIQPNEETLCDSPSTIASSLMEIVSLPWKQFHQPLPDNYCIVFWNVCVRTLYSYTGLQLHHSETDWEGCSGRCPSDSCWLGPHSLLASPCDCP